MAVAATTAIGARPSRAAHQSAIPPATSFVGEFVGPSSRLDPVLLRADSEAAGGDA